MIPVSRPTVEIRASSSLPRNSRPAAILFTMCLGIFIAQLDSSVVNLAAKSIGADLHAGVNGLQWVLDSYNLFYASLLLTGGTLSDLYGRRRIFMSGLAVFTLGSLVCGFAPGMEWLIVGRSVTGVGAAMLLPSSLAILTVAYPDAKARAWAISIWASCNGLAFTIGPTLGGWLIGWSGWRSIFLLVVPVSLWAFWRASRCLAESANPTGRRLDVPGQVLAILALSCLTLAATEGPHWGWSGGLTGLVIGVGVAAGALFLAVESRAGKGAMIPLSLFGGRVFSASIAVTALMTFGMYGFLFLMPLYFQIMRGADAVTAGVEMAPMAFAFFAVSRSVGKLVSKIGPRLATTLGMIGMGGGLVAISAMDATAPLWSIELAMLTIGVGLGLNTGPVLAVTVASVPENRSGMAGGLSNTARMVGATLGVAVLGAVYALYAGAAFGDNLDTAAMFTGFRTAVLWGGLAELFGALIAVLFIRRDSLERTAAVAEARS
jgi:EmrB/QacA subfamily drug resistance transporter